MKNNELQRGSGFVSFLSQGAFLKETIYSSVCSARLSYT
jgi:hypothetical protein